MNTYVVNYGRKMYVFRRSNNEETTDMFADRCWKMAKWLERGRVEATDAEPLSRIWCNARHMGLEYDPIVWAQVPSD